MNALRRALLGLIPILAGFGSGTLAQGLEVTEATVKAAFLYRFSGYVEWPDAALEATTASEFVIGVMGNDAVFAELEKIVPGRNVAGRPLAVRRVRDIDALKGVQLLFVGRSESARLPAVIRVGLQRGILIVTESERGLEAGSVINFVVSDNRVGFEVSLDAAERSGHRVSSRMLAVARRVIPRSG